MMIKKLKKNKKNPVINLQIKKKKGLSGAANKGFPDTITDDDFKNEHKKGLEKFIKTRSFDDFAGFHTFERKFIDIKAIKQNILKDEESSL